ncbi:MAG: serine hydrolase domain-containing protein [Polyangiales bacterium]
MRSAGTNQDRDLLLLETMVERGKVPGLVYVVFDRDATVYSWYGGCVARDSIFMLSSTTKVIIALAVMQLMERGALALQDPLSRYYPESPYPQSLKLAHLLSHSGGVPNPLPLRWLHLESEHVDYDEMRALSRVLAAHPELSFEPGTRYQYSNLGYWLLGIVIEAAAKQDLEDYLHDHVRVPLGIQARDLSFDIQDPERMVVGHQKRSLLGLLLKSLTDRKIWAERSGRWRRMRRLYHDGRAYGGLYANAGALQRIMQDLLRDEPKLLHKRSRDQFFASQTNDRGRPLGATLGWSEGRLGGKRWVGKPGGGPGFFSNVRIYPGQGRATILLVNCTEVRDHRINRLSDRLDSHFVG